VTSGQHGGRDYGHDYQAYPPQHPDHDGQSGWGAGSTPAAGRNGYHHRDHPQQPGYQQPDYAGAGYPSEDHRFAGYQQPGYQQPGYGESGYGESGYGESGYGESGYGESGYQGSAYRDSAYQDSAYQGSAYQEPAYPGYRRQDEDYPTASYRAVARTPDDHTVALERRRPADIRPAADVARSKRKRRGLPLWQELPLLLIIAFCLAILVRTFLLQAFYIPSGSMEDTLIAGDRVLVNKVVYQFREPARGEVVVFRGTDAWAPVETDEGDIGTFARIGRTLGDLVGVSRPGEKDFIKRVIGLPGDTVSCCSVDGQVFVNGQPLDENYVIRDSPLDEGEGSANDCRSRQFDEVVVQPGHMFVMGDHRQVSQDSRCQGQVPIDNVIGRAFVIVWPNGRWNSLPQPETFANVPPSATAAGPLAPLPPGPLAQLPFVLPILLPLGWTGRRRMRAEPESLWSPSARSRLIGRHSGRRLAE
jgi:signal peptidase I